MKSKKQTLVEFIEEWLIQYDPKFRRKKLIEETQKMFHEGLSWSEIREQLDRAIVIAYKIEFDGIIEEAKKTLK